MENDGTFSRKLRSERGAAVVELALVAPLFLFLTFGLIDFGIALYRHQVIQNAARDGARRAVVFSGTQAVVQTRIQNTLSTSGLDVSKATITFSCDGVTGSLCPATPANRGKEEGVDIDYPHEFLFVGPIVALICPSCGGDMADIVLRGVSRMRQE